MKRPTGISLATGSLLLGLGAALVLCGITTAQPAATSSAPGPAVGTRPAGNQAPRRVEPAIDPHWSKSRCGDCHQMVEGKAQPIQPGQVDRLCLSCHDGRRAIREVHPVDRPATGQQVLHPEGWPLVNGRLTCRTCHEFKRSHCRGGPRPADNPAFLRDYQGGPVLGFCRNCHAATEQEVRYNPHRMLDSAGKPMLKACQFCHDSPDMPVNAMVRTGRPRLRTPQPALCLSCHFQHVDYFEPGHIGIEVPPRIRAYMLAAERVPPGQTPTPEQIQRFMNSDELPTRLPLQDGKRVVCSTCHNPHEKGVFPAGSPLALGAIHPGAERLRHRLRGLGKELCRGCHIQ
jgi:predicted CXXCH cytochrome family protein